MGISGRLGSRWLRGQNLNLAECPTRFRRPCLYSSITARGPRQDHPPSIGSNPLTQFAPDLATNFSNPD